MINKIFFNTFLRVSYMGMFLFLAGCTPNLPGNTGQVQSYDAPVIEARWIRNGEPIEFEGEKWYPVDGVDVLTDNEVLLLGQYQGVNFFVHRVDVRPYDRLYTKFGKNQFRFYQKKTNQ